MKLNLTLCRLNFFWSSGVGGRKVPTVDIFKTIRRMVMKLIQDEGMLNPSTVYARTLLLW